MEIPAAYLKAGSPQKELAMPVFFFNADLPVYHVFSVLSTLLEDLRDLKIQFPT